MPSEESNLLKNVYCAIILLLFLLKMYRRSSGKVSTKVFIDRWDYEAIIMVFSSCLLMFFYFSLEKNYLCNQMTTVHNVLIARRIIWRVNGLPSLINRHQLPPGQVSKNVSLWVPPAKGHITSKTGLLTLHRDHLCSINCRTIRNYRFHCLTLWCRQFGPHLNRFVYLLKERSL